MSFGPKKKATVPEADRSPQLKRYYKDKEVMKAQNRAWRQNMRMSILSYYSGGTMSCACCGEMILEFLTLDHMNNNGTAERKKYANGGHQHYRRIIKLGYPEGFQVLCYNCNCGRAKTRDKVCPHKNTI